MISHYRQLKATLEAECPCFIGDPDLNIAPPYTFIWGIDSERLALTACGQVDALDDWLKVSVVAETANNTLALAERIIPRLTSAQLDVPGWVTFPIREYEIGVNGPISQRGVFENDTDRYPSLVVLDVRLQATRKDVA